MTMTRDMSVDEPRQAFWLDYPDQTQAAVHLALQWLAYVYPAGELHIEATLKHAQPYADADLSSRWSLFLDENDVEEHVEALQWIKKTFSVEQIPFLVETCWRLLLVDHELPSHAPLALRILGRVLDVDEPTMMALGETVNREYMDENQDRNRAPLLPIDPRYLDRVEWRLLGHKTTQRFHHGTAMHASKSVGFSTLIGFILGALFGSGLVVFLVFGPLQLGRIKVPIMLHDGLLLEETDPFTEPDTQIQAIETGLPSAPAPPAALPVPEGAAVSDDVIDTATRVETPLPLIDSEDDITIPAVDSTTAEGEDNSVLMQVTASILNVRGQPNVNSDVLIKLGKGAQVWAYPQESEGLWMLIRVEGVTGYASARFLSDAQ